MSGKDSHSGLAFFKIGVAQICYECGEAPGFRNLDLQRNNSGRNVGSEPTIERHDFTTVLAARNAFDLDPWFCEWVAPHAVIEAPAEPSQRGVAFDLQLDTVVLRRRDARASVGRCGIEAQMQIFAAAILVREEVNLAVVSD